MADIKQAAKWIDRGEKVRRTSVQSLAIFREDFVGSIEFADDPTKLDDPEDCEPDQWENAVFSTEDLLADDWEIAA